jgi:hypothetical protein
MLLFIYFTLSDLGEGSRHLDLFGSSISYFQISGKVRAILICSVSYDWDLMANVSAGTGNDTFEESAYVAFTLSL